MQTLEVALGVVGGLVLLGALLAVSWVGRPGAGSRGGVGLTLVRSLLPAWRFFETVEATPLLLYRVVGGPRGEGAWTPVIPPAPRPWTALVFDPRGTALLACHSVVDRLVSDLAEREGVAPEELDALVSWSLARHMVSAVAGLPPGTPHQLRLMLVEHGPDHDTIEQVVLTSRIYEA